MTAQEQIEPYGKFVFLTEESKEKFRNMSEEDLDFISGVIAHQLNMSCYRLEQEMKEKDNARTD
jgi:hypothetical protein